MGSTLGSAIGGLGSGLISTIIFNGIGSLVEASFSNGISSVGDVFEQFIFGGTVGGAMFAFGLGGLATGFVSSAVSSFVGNGLEMVTGKCEVDILDLILNVGAESILGGITGSLINIPGVNGGSHSMQQVFRSGITKVWKKGFSMSTKVMLKGFFSQYGTNYGSVLYSLIKELLSK